MTPTTVPSAALQATAASGGGAAPRAGARRVLAQLGVLVGYTVRESLHKWLLIAFLAATTLFLALLASTVSLDIVEGTIASARLFGQQVELADESIRISDVVTTFQVLIASLLYTAGLFLALFTTSNLVPRLCAPGWVGLVLAQPISRGWLLIGRVLGATVVVAVNLGYLIVGSWLLLTWKTGVGTPGFLAAGALILYAYVVLYSAMVLVGVVTGSSPVSLIVGAATWISGLTAYGLHAHPGWLLSLRAGGPREVARALTDGLYWSLPKTYELGAAVSNATRMEPVDLTPVATSAPFAIVCLALACWWFTRQDY